MLRTDGAARAAHGAAELWASAPVLRWRAFGWGRSEPPVVTYPVFAPGNAVRPVGPGSGCRGIGTEGAVLVSAESGFDNDPPTIWRVS